MCLSTHLKHFPRKSRQYNTYTHTRTYTRTDGRTLKGKSMNKQNNNLVVEILSDEDRTQTHILTVCLPSG